MRLTQRRKAVGLSQERLAEILGVDTSTVRRWEYAATEPQPWHRPKLARALKVTIDELAIILAETTRPPQQPNERLTYALTHPSSVDHATVGYLREQIVRLDRQYDQRPSSSLLAEVGQLHGHAIYLSSHAANAHVRRELWAAEAESSLLMGQLCWDTSQRRDHHGATSHFDRAIVAARQAEDPTVEACAELRKSYVALYGTGDPHYGLVLTQRATAASGRSQVVRGLAVLHRAEAHAMLGDEKSCLAALAEAEADLSRRSLDDPASALFCPTTPGRLTGSCYLRLGQPAKAEPILNATYRVLQQHKKSTSIVLGNISLAHIRMDNLDGAVENLHQAIDVIERTHGGGGLNVAFAVARELQPWRNEPAVIAVNDRLLALMTGA